MDKLQAGLHALRAQGKHVAGLDAARALIGKAREIRRQRMLTNANLAASVGAAATAEDVQRELESGRVSMPLHPEMDSPEGALLRHTRACGICNHPERDAINRAFVEGQSVQSIAEEFGLTHTATVYRHAHALDLFFERDTAWERRHLKTQQNSGVSLLERPKTGGLDDTTLIGVAA